MRDQNSLFNSVFNLIQLTDQLYVLKSNFLDHYHMWTTYSSNNQPNYSETETGLKFGVTVFFMNILPSMQTRKYHSHSFLADAKKKACDRCLLFSRWLFQLFVYEYWNRSPNPQICILPLCSSGSRKSCRPLGRLRTTSQEYPSSGRRNGSWRSGSSSNWTSLPSLLASSSAVFSATATTWSISSYTYVHTCQM